jgi:hypothetical protein
MFEDDLIVVHFILMVYAVQVCKYLWEVTSLTGNNAEFSGGKNIGVEGSKRSKTNGS